MTYLDYAASSLKRKDVLQDLINKIEEYDGNPSSTHTLGRKSNKYLEEARKIIAGSINSSPKDVFFTSGASESNNMVIKNFDDENFEIISSMIEHKSVLESLKNVDSKVILIDSQNSGRIALEDLVSKITEKTKLVCLIYVNNETGIIQPVEEVGNYLKDKNIWFHVDAVQALGHIDIDVNKLNCDSMSLSGHKLGGMNGFGIIYLKNRIKPLINGGNQEKSQRAGTSNLLAAMSMAKSIEPTIKERDRIWNVKEYFIEELKNIPFEINGDQKYSTNHIVNIYFPFAKSDLLLTYLDMNNIYVSSGSACLAGALEPSYVIENMYDKERAKRSIRFSFGYSNTKEEIDKVIKILTEFYERKSFK
ncbi:cysteine desulfurase family protein [Helcococcus bovis]|uniref:cysteine desulfurase family protein n=1 Tax=Helcococcus bovis TaxID=3153252 RepID=UPI0038BDBE0F